MATTTTTCQTTPARVRAVRFFGPDLFELVLDRGALDFAPGDCVALVGPDGRVSRPYSLASGTGEPVLRFVIRRHPRGVVSGFLATRRPGDVVQRTESFGWFRPGRRQGNDGGFVFVATGTGIAPFLSALRSDPDHPPRHCLWGLRRWEDAVDRQAWPAAADLRLALSRERRPGVFHGRVTALIETLPLDRSFHFYLCGWAGMIQDVGAWLRDQGVPAIQIHREVFFHASSDRTSLAAD